MQEVIQVGDQYYILARSSLADDRTLVLKHDETFAVFDSHGDVYPLGMGEQGLFHEGTRFLSRLELRLGGERPLLLESTVHDRNELLAVDFMNPDLFENGIAIPRGTLHLFRSKFLWRGVCYERIRIANFGPERVRTVLSLGFDADFADIFEVRGIERRQKGEKRPPRIDDSSVSLSYRGLDGQMRCSHLRFSPRPDELDGERALFRVSAEPGDEVMLYLNIACECGQDGHPAVSFQSAFADACQLLEQTREKNCRIETSNEQFNEWLDRSFADLQMMFTRTPQGFYPYAGVPWFSAPFGRDGIITAMEMLWVNPEVARGVLAFLAHTQATEENPKQDAEPGKILHEARRGEMAALGEIPFGRYYGSVDATPLFVSLAGHYFQATADQAFIETIWPQLRRAVEWMDRYGDADGDGYLEYARHTPEGLMQQGWKDSWDSVFHADGSAAEGPIALVEVQGYAYDARLQAARIATVLNDHAFAHRQQEQANRLREKFAADFWCPELGSYALALDGRKRPCRVRTSNAGHALFSGIATREHAAHLAQTLLSPVFFTGWGIRTVAAGEARYNPMSYHNGSIWPHDNAMVAAGLARYGFTNECLKILQGLFHTATAIDLHRMPELFCGFKWRSGFGPILYPVACAPQAWAAASVFLLLQSCLGLAVDAREKTIRFSYPALPDFLQEVRLLGVRAGEASADLLVRRHEQDVGVNVLRRQGEVRIELIK